jgi:two-component system OmpR family sensor kinase
MIDMLEMGAHRGDPARIQRILDTMNREVQRLGRLVADLLTLSRLDADQPLRAGGVDTGDLVAEVAQQTRLIATGQQVDLEIEAHPVVWGDADRLKQVLLNLASNALAHTPAGGRILFQVESANGRARIIVADTGSGIAPDLLPRVMDRFSRGDDSRSRATGGAGLGLSIARGIVEAHHGAIALASEAGEGTTVTVELPIWDGVHQPPASAQRQVSTSGTPSA